MGQKLHPTSPDLLIHPGETISEAIEDRGINQKELATRTGFSEKHISTVINGKKSISAKLALALEIALDIPASFWNTLQSNYSAEVELFNESHEISSKEIDIAKELVEVTETLTKQKLDASNPSILVLVLRRFLGIHNLTSIKKLTSTYYRGQFNVSTNDYIMYAWQYLSEKQAEGQTENPFDRNLLLENLDNIKKIMFLKETDHIKELTKIFNKCGILFVVNKHVKKAPIHGLTTKTKTNKVLIAMTIRNKYIDTFWFSLFHEIAHLINKDYLIKQIDQKKIKEIERKADEFAKNMLINKDNYNAFIKKGNFTDNDIIAFAKENNVLPGIVAGRLMKEELISWSQNSLRTKYQYED